MCNTSKQGKVQNLDPRSMDPPPPTPLFLDQVHGPGHALPILLFSEKFFLRDTDVYINRGGIHEL